MKELKIIIGDASGCTAAEFKVNGRGTCVQKAGKAKVGDVANVICKHEFDCTEIGLCKLVKVGPRDKWDLRAGKAQYVWEVLKMSDPIETSKDILAEMCQPFPPETYWTNTEAENTLNDYAIRLSAAIKREMQGNVAKLREALTGVRDWLVRANKEDLDALATSQCIVTAKSVNNCAKSVIEGNKFHLEEIEAALAAPPRNCDVGDPSEQANRFEGYCKRYDHCTPCPVHAGWDFSKTKHPSCALYWAQMTRDDVPKEGGDHAKA